MDGFDDATLHDDAIKADESRAPPSSLVLFFLKALCTPQYAVELSKRVVKKLRGMGFRMRWGVGIQISGVRVHRLIRLVS